MPPNSTPHLLWARPVSRIALFLSLHAYTALLPALHAFRLCHQYGNSTTFLLPPLSRLPPYLALRIEKYLIAAYRREVHSRWTHRLETAAPCNRCLTAPATREDELRKQICHCRAKFRRELEVEVGRLFVGKGCGTEIWDVGDGKKMTTGRVLRRYCGLELFVEGGYEAGEGLWLCLPFMMKGGNCGEGEDEEKGRVGICKGYMLLKEEMIRRFKFVVETLGMEGEVKDGNDWRRLDHWHCVDERKDTVNGVFGVNLYLFSAGFVVS